MGLDIFKNLLASGATSIADAASNIIKDFKADPTKVVEAEAAIEQLKIQAKTQTENIQSQIEIAYLSDIQSARKANADIQMSDKPPVLVKLRPTILAYFIAIVWGAITLYIAGRFFNIISIDSKVDMTGILALYASVNLLMGTVINFDFGSSQSSKDKDQTISSMAKN